MSEKPQGQVTIIGSGDLGDEHPAWRAAFAVGRGLSDRGLVVVTGGRSGVMAAANAGARAGRLGVSVGILPGSARADANPSCTVVIPTGLGNARNALTVLAGDCVIAVGGSAGTLSEVGLALKYGRPVCVLADAALDLPPEDNWPAEVLVALRTHAAYGRLLSKAESVSATLAWVDAVLGQAGRTRAR